MNGPRIVSLFSGVGGLEMGIQSVLGGDVVAHVEFDADPSTVLAHHWPDVPNLGDVTAVDWAAFIAEHPELGDMLGTYRPGVIMCGGFPCQDVSLAGRRRGLKDGTRSGLWSEFARAIDEVRPELVVIENVRGLLSAEADRNMESSPWSVGDRPDGPALRALGAVLGDLADLGYDAEWTGIRAADAGAPHARYRIFVIAYPAGHAWRVGHGDDVQTRRGAGGRREDSGRGGSSADADGRRDRGRTVAPGHGEGTESDTQAHGSDPRADGTPAQDADGAARGERGIAAPGQAEGGRARADAGRRGRAPSADADGRRHGEQQNAGGVGRVDRENAGGARERERSRPLTVDRGADAPDADGDGLASVGGLAPERRHTDRRSREAETAWGPYEPAVRRWEAVLGRAAPAPTQLSETYLGRVARRLLGLDVRPVGMRGSLKPVHQLSPRLVEWMMGYPAGHVTGAGISRNAQLKALGNAVVPQQAALALRELLA